MSEPIKVHEGLTTLQRGQAYHLGYYAVDFQDGDMRFELFARICPEKNCPCDNIQIDWHAPGGSVFHSWLGADGSWKDHEHQPVHPEMENVFRIVQDIEMFKERYEHLLFLRRRMVLEEAHRYEQPFGVRVPKSVLMPGADPDKQILGTVKLEGRKGRKTVIPYNVEFCGDPNCYCENLFLALGEGRTSFCIEPDDKWSAVGGEKEDISLMGKVKQRLTRHKQFASMLGFFRQERKLHNYHRHVHNRRNVNS